MRQRAASVPPAAGGCAPPVGAKPLGLARRRLQRKFVRTRDPQPRRSPGQVQRKRKVGTALSPGRTEGSLHHRGASGRGFSGRISAPGSPLKTADVLIDGRLQKRCVSGSGTARGNACCGMSSRRTAWRSRRWRPSGPAQVYLLSFALLGAVLGVLPNPRQSAPETRFTGRAAPGLAAPLSPTATNITSSSTRRPEALRRRLTPVLPKGLDHSKAPRHAMGCGRTARSSQGGTVRGYCRFCHGNPAALGLDLEKTLARRKGRFAIERNARPSIGNERDFRPAPSARAYSPCLLGTTTASSQAAGVQPLCATNKTTADATATVGAICSGPDGVLRHQPALPPCTRAG